jgi:hypothetical protein
VNPLHVSFRIPPRGRWFCNLLPLKGYKEEEKRMIGGQMQEKKTHKIKEK